GVEEAKEELQEIIEFLKEPQKFQKLGGRIPRGVLLLGPRVPEKHCSRAQSQARPMFRSSRSADRSSLKCSSAWVPRAFAIFSGADLANLVNEAALNAAGMNQKMVTHEDFESAKDKVLMGAARKSLIISEHEKRVTAYHEAGHAMVATMVEGADPLHKVTIIP